MVSGGIWEVDLQTWVCFEGMFPTLDSKNTLMANMLGAAVPLCLPSNYTATSTGTSAAETSNHSILYVHDIKCIASYNMQCLLFDC